MLYFIFLLGLFVLILILSFIRKKTYSGGGWLSDQVKRLDPNRIYTLEELPEFKPFFPPIPELDKIQVNAISLYSITPIYVMYSINNLIRNILGVYSLNNWVITDATANIGGSVIGFATQFKFVNAVEISPKECEILKHNLKIYDLRNVKVFCKNYIDILNDLTQDIIFIDPPWGGTDYINLKKVNLNLGGIDLAQVVNMIKNPVKLILLKVPVNFNFKKFKTSLKFEWEISKKEVINHIIIISLLNKPGLINNG